MLLLPRGGRRQTSGIVVVRCVCANQEFRGLKFGRSSASGAPRRSAAQQEAPRGAPGIGTLGASHAARDSDAGSGSAVFSRALPKHASLLHRQVGASLCRSDVACFGVQHETRMANPVFVGPQSQEKSEGRRPPDQRGPDSGRRLKRRAKMVRRVGVPVREEERFARVLQGPPKLTAMAAGCARGRFLAETWVNQHGIDRVCLVSCLFSKTR